ncbi:MAG: hypothetical protein EOO77_36185 [Oxalobacteraceae bacterium]|nr:MAG: hypothetical protein EOO77_36185 [Oxalobacteraceae bacterium]
MEALFLRSGAKKLFASYYPGDRDEGFVICYPAPQDMMRANHSQVLLSRKLQSQGFPVMRFDYLGTGDSAGEITTLKQWREDLMDAVAAFKKKSGVKTVSLIGTRLGATLAVLSSQEVGFKRLILWDPVINGIELLDSYRKAHDMMLHRVPVEAPYPARSARIRSIPGVYDVAGPRWAPQMRTQKIVDPRSTSLLPALQISWRFQGSSWRSPISFFNGRRLEIKNVRLARFYD